jgi:hypothetical protein
MRGVFRMLPSGALVLALALCITAVLAVPAGAAGPATCSGTVDSPGTLVGTISGNVQVSGVCFVDAGPLVVNGNLTVQAGAALIAAFGATGSDVTINGNLDLKNGAAMVLGCNPVSSPCFDDNPDNPTLTVTATVNGNMTSSQALGVVVHNTTVGGNVEQHGGGGGFNCDPSGVFAAFGSPVFSTYEDSSVGGNLDISNVSSCWMGTARVDIGGNASYVNNQLADPDAIEIVLNHIHGNLSCQGNSMVWDSGDLSDNLFPRAPQPNTVDGKRSGQCVLSSPTSPGGPSGPGSF